MNRIFPDYYRGPAGKTPTNPFDRIDKLDKQQASYLGNNYEMGNGVYGNYDGLRLKANPYNGWKAEPANNKLIDSDFLFVPQGTPLPLANEMIYSQIPKDSMFAFAKNRASPNCRSDYSTSTGQVCTTLKQQSNIGEKRGNNKNFPDDSF
jgi:hypothetical protein